MDLVTRNAAMAAENAAVVARARAQELTEQEADVLRLYAAGATLNKLCEVAKVKTTAGALKFVRRVLAKHAAVIDSTPITEARALMMARLELVVTGNLASAAMGDDKASKTVLAALQAEARLLGLDAPRRHEHEHHLADTPAARTAREQAVRLSLEQFGNRVIEGEAA